jgi:transcriptional regulator with XRE-family HTH domain
MAACLPSLIESGERPTPSPATLSMLAQVLGISLDWLIDGKGPVPSVDGIRAAVEAAKAVYEGRAA